MLTEEALDLPTEGEESPQGKDASLCHSLRHTAQIFPLLKTLGAVEEGIVVPILILRMKLQSFCKVSPKELV